MDIRDSKVSFKHEKYNGDGQSCVDRLKKRGYDIHKVALMGDYIR